MYLGKAAVASQVARIDVLRAAYGRPHRAPMFNKGNATMHNYTIEYTDTFGGEANYSWVKRASVTMPELTHYGYDGLHGYSKANRTYERELMKLAKAKMGLTGIRGITYKHGDMIEFRPYRSCTVMFVTFKEGKTQ